MLNKAYQAGVDAALAKFAASGISLPRKAAEPKNATPPTEPKNGVGWSEQTKAPEPSTRRAS